MAHIKVSQSEADRLISLADGTGAYVLHSDGCSERLSTDSPQFVAAINKLIAEGHGKRIRTQIDTLANDRPRSNWPKVKASLEVAGVFDA